jgi:hypothetical protein
MKQKKAKWRREPEKGRLVPVFEQGEEQAGAKSH